MPPLTLACLVGGSYDGSFFPANVPAFSASVLDLPIPVFTYATCVAGYATVAWYVGADAHGVHRD